MSEAAPDPRPATAGLALAAQRRVYAAFALHAISMGSLFPRLPEVRDALGVAEGALGLALMGAPVGTLLALAFASPFIERAGFRRTLLASTPLVALCYAVAVWMPTPLALFAALVPAGLLVGCVEIVVNVEADRTEARLGRRIMNRAHSFWSFGFFLAGIVGAAMAHAGVSPRAHLALVALAVAAAVAALLGGYRPAPHRAADAAPATGFARPTAPILVLVGVTLSAMLMEGAGLEWSALYMVEVHASAPFVAGLAVATVAFSQATGRFFADGFIDRSSPEGVGRTLLWCLGAGIVTVFLAPSPALSLAGFALIGLGSSVIFPLAISAAARRTDRPATVNVAALSQIAFCAFFLAPPLLGQVAEHAGMRWVFGLGLPLVALSLVTVGALRDAPDAPDGADAHRGEAGAVTRP